MFAYLTIDLLSLSVPLIVSFDKRIRLFKDWLLLLGTITVSSIPFIIWDIYFTNSGYWGFSNQYLLNIDILNLPIEEWLFFYCIPYACIFTHVSIIKIRPLRLGIKTTKLLTSFLTILLLIILFFHHEKAYTSWCSIFTIIILLTSYITNKELLQSYFITFPVILIPFLIVNGILTGFGIENEIVWYNNEQNLGFRILTIPIEDFFYAFSMVLLNLMIYNKFKIKYNEDLVHSS